MSDVLDAVPTDFWIAVLSVVVTALVGGLSRVAVSLRKLRLEEQIRAEEREAQRKEMEAIKERQRDAELRLYQRLRDEIQERRQQVQGLQDQLTQARTDIQQRDRVIERLRRVLARYLPAGASLDDLGPGDVS